MIKQVPVSGIDENTGGAVDQIGVAVVGGHRFPHKCMNVICDLQERLPLFNPNFSFYRIPC
jgi:hypothetical protein